MASRVVTQPRGTLDQKNAGNAHQPLTQRSFLPRPIVSSNRDGTLQAVSYSEARRSDPPSESGLRPENVNA